MEGAAYLLAGMRLESEIPLPELPRLEHSSPLARRVRIRRGTVAFELPGAIEIDPDCLATGVEFLLRIPGVARYRVSHGKEIVVDAAEHALPLDVRAYLLGSVFSVLCHQRGLLPLHASAIRFKLGVAAFLGESGDGKSSLAAHMAARGHPVVADDICLVETGLGASACVIPSAPWLKLWRGSIERLGRRAEDLEQVFSEDDKYRLPLVSPAEPETESSHPTLNTLIFLERSQTGGSAGVRFIELPRLRAMNGLMRLTHQAFLLEALGLREENFMRCGKVLSGAKTYRLIRPWGFEYMDETVRLVEQILNAS